jgi:hypothetical protein
MIQPNATHVVLVSETDRPYPRVVAAGTYAAVVAVLATLTESLHADHYERIVVGTSSVTGIDDGCEIHYAITTVDAVPIYSGSADQPQFQERPQHVVDAALFAVDPAAERFAVDMDGAAA